MANKEVEPQLERKKLRRVIARLNALANYKGKQEICYDLFAYERLALFFNEEVRAAVVALEEL